MRYVCKECGSTARFRARAEAKIDVVVNGDGEIIEQNVEHQFIDDKDINILEIRDCLKCGSVNIEEVKT